MVVNNNDVSKAEYLMDYFKKIKDAENKKLREWSEEKIIEERGKNAKQFLDEYPNGVEDYIIL